MSRINLVLAVATTAALMAACSSSKGSSSSSTSAPATSAAAATTAAPAPSTPVQTSSAAASASKSSVPPAAGLSGTWHGHYGGAFTGTFVLKWAQSSSKLTGTIDLSTSGTVPITGSVSGGHIRFGTVGSTAVTYTGSVSGSSMSGHYQISGGAGGSGTWSASRG